MPSEAPPTNPRAGRWARQQEGPEAFYAFVPAPLPPEPPVQFAGRLQDLLERANRAVGRLDGIAALLPNPRLFLYSYIRKEAVLSSQIEGTQSSLSQLLLFEIKESPGVPVEDVREVSNYVAALELGLKRLKNLPLCMRLLREIHERLLRGVRGNDKTPGEFRRSQNWIGGTRPGNAHYVPPPVEELGPALNRLEKFLHGETPTLIKAGLAHAQFETIHPFLDGNGRLGRLLVTFVLCAEHALKQPLLYLSLYFKTHRQAYYNALQRIRTDGHWEGWMDFYLSGVEEVARQAAQTIQDLTSLYDSHRRQVQKTGKGAASTLQVLDLFRLRIVLNPSVAEHESGLSYPTVNASMAKLEKLGIVRETTGNRRNRIYAYMPFLKILNEGTQPAPSSSHPA